MRESHIVPNAYFRAMKKGSNGKLISMDTSPDSVAMSSQDSLSEPLLCAECEERLCKWETPWIRKLRVTAKQFKAGVDEVAVKDHDHASLKCFLVSIIWRASVCSRPEFSGVMLPGPVLETIRADLLAGNAPPAGVIGVRIRKLVDPTGQLGDLERFVFTPARFSEGGIQGYRLFFAGYVVDYLTSRVTREVTKIRGFVRDTPAMSMPSISCFDVREFMRVGRSMVGKHVRGLTAFKGALAAE